MKRKNLIVVLVVLVMVLVVSTVKMAGFFDWFSKGDNEFKSEINFKGSSTLAPVISKISSSFMEENQTWDKVDKQFPKKEIQIFVAAGGSGAGIKAVTDGTTNFGMVSRNTSSSEQNNIDGYKEFKLGVDALTVAINPKNRVKHNLTTEEIRKIFAGQYKYWNQINDNLPHKEIIVVTRDLGGGAHKVFQKKVMGDLQVKSSAIQAPSMGALVNKIMENEYAIGYASVGVVNRNEGKIIPLSIDGVAPTKENIISGDYKISRPLLVIKGGEIPSAEQAFLEVLLSSESANIIEKMGFIPAK
ncbi:phosphate ABC transporter substrate-binding protein [Halocella sp. SP3-1]|uniref:phosphate ABC transporter substrate-binding protein n=1 Tax=Halocella sp. SP3-1 TaxID=2382161 RepID=UPI000F75ED7D|nr:phosphate ABC transporter substrate-binding protein [Halocella sp. SP3-1]AZO94726.1 phosphate ABC transporter substrate-binding protein [Halocella sp. SP3-1]